MARSPIARAVLIDLFVASALSSAARHIAWFLLCVALFISAVTTAAVEQTATFVGHAGIVPADALAHGNLGNPGTFTRLQEVDEDFLLADDEGGRDTASSLGAGTPHLIQLRRESVPIYRDGAVVSFKTSYSGLLHLGTPAQDFRVVFDTGSGNIVVPAAECTSESCLSHRRFDTLASRTATVINTDGLQVHEGELGDQVTIGFGSGEITGELVRDRVCIGSSSGTLEARQLVDDSNHSSVASSLPLTPPSGLCLEMNVVVSVEMSSQPFSAFNFDGILGLGLDALSIGPGFNAFGLLGFGQAVAAPRFGAFISEGGEDGEDDSEMAFGGFNPARLLEPLSWAPVAMPELGYWQVEIIAVRINGRELDLCSDGTCRAIVDTGTSHLGIPASHTAIVEELLKVPAGDLIDCRLAQAPEIQFELRGFNITIHPGTYMRRLPLPGSVSLQSTSGLYAADSAVPAQSTSMRTRALLSKASTVSPIVVPEKSGSVCSPRTLGVRLPEPLGPKLFVLGEPLLHRYYTVFDRTAPSIGFGLANNRRNSVLGPGGIDAVTKAVLPEDVDFTLGDLEGEVLIMMQLRVSVTVVAARAMHPEIMPCS